MNIRQSLRRLFRCLRQGQPTLRPKMPSRPLRMEQLEDRAVPASVLTLDFGFGFEGGALNVNNFQMAKPSLNGPLKFDWFSDHPLVSLTRTLQDPRVVGGNLNRDKVIDEADARFLADQVVGHVRRIFEPLDVTVQVRESRNLHEIADVMNETGTPNAYVVVAGDDPPDEPAYGWARVDRGNLMDNVGFAFADEIIRTRPTSEWATALAMVAAHEAAHTYGLDHVLDTSPLAVGDVMQGRTGETERRGFSVVNLFSRFPLPVEDGASTVNGYEVLKGTVGARPNGPDYVTGTGGCDRITITRLSATEADVRVEAFSTPTFAPGTELANHQYVVKTTHGLLVEGGVNPDQFIIDGNLGTTITVRGGSGADMVTYQGTDNPDHMLLDVGSLFHKSPTEYGVVHFDETEGLEINGGAGADRLTVWFRDADGNPQNPIPFGLTFNGGEPTSSPGDELVLAGVRVQFGPFVGDGRIEVGGYPIWYTGLDPLVGP